MQKPKTFAEAGWRQSLPELFALYLATAVAAAHFLMMHWVIAMLVAPFLVFAVLGGIMACVQALWLAVLALEKVGTSLGFRKSPLA